MKLPLLDTFEDACVAANLKPRAVLKEAGIHPTLWWKWRHGRVVPRLDSFEAVASKLEEMGGTICDCGGSKPRKAKNGAH